MDATCRSAKTRKEAHRLAPVARCLGGLRCEAPGVSTPTLPPRRRAPGRPLPYEGQEAARRMALAAAGAIANGRAITVFPTLRRGSASSCCDHRGAFDPPVPPCGFRRPRALFGAETAKPSSRASGACGAGKRQGSRPPRTGCGERGSATRQGRLALKAVGAPPRRGTSARSCAPRAAVPSGLRFSVSFEESGRRVEAAQLGRARIAAATAHCVPFRWDDTTPSGRLENRDLVAIGREGRMLAPRI